MDVRYQLTVELVIVTRLCAARKRVDFSGVLTYYWFHWQSNSHKHKGQAMQGTFPTASQIEEIKTMRREVGCDLVAAINAYRFFLGRPAQDVQGNQINFVPTKAQTAWAAERWKDEVFTGPIPGCPLCGWESIATECGYRNLRDGEFTCPGCQMRLAVELDGPEATTTVVMSACALCGEDCLSDASKCGYCGGDPATQELECEECEGRGEHEVLDLGRVTAVTISPPYRSVPCEGCDGVGWTLAPYLELRDPAAYRAAKAARGAAHVELHGISDEYWMHLEMSDEALESFCPF